MRLNSGPVVTSSPAPRESILLFLSLAYRLSFRIFHDFYDADRRAFRGILTFLDHHGRKIESMCNLANEIITNRWNSGHTCKYF